MCKNRSPSCIGKSINNAVDHLRQGGVVAFPTETYYGLAVDPSCSSAVTKVYAMKKRQKDKPLLLLIEKIEQLGLITQMIPPVYLALIKKYWPGALTLIFPAKSTLNHQITGETGTVGVRISPHPVAQELVRRMGTPITATSANISGRPPAQSAKEVEAMFGNAVDYILDGGKTAAGLCSTILGIHNSNLTLIRPGQIDLSRELARSVENNE